jgi:cold-inducible RNA-binding protein
VGKKLYVGNLTYSVTRTDLEEWFTNCGTVQSAQVIQDRDMGRSKGFGFVEMDTDAQAEAAIQGLNDHEHDGRRLKVAEAKPRVARTVGFTYGNEQPSGFRINSARGDCICILPELLPWDTSRMGSRQGKGGAALKPAGFVRGV